MPIVLYIKGEVLCPACVQPFDFQWAAGRGCEQLAQPENAVQGTGQVVEETDARAQPVLMAEVVLECPHGEIPFRIRKSAERVASRVKGQDGPGSTS